ncbi:hypothetical protein SAMN05216312_103331 [Cohnella sp. OV330]|uniref:hypothetical protein n=1 Tax=Cohnella sp. OV330 TaxID=1855288 RepID=UPI0008EAA7A4|nr:hypothetical protein [Cohnella sp. OV330]SFB06907.1 hypothetical protein SAMN05216312_103331 [Cohnella sp. OV330]
MGGILLLWAAKQDEFNYTCAGISEEQLSAVAEVAGALDIRLGEVKSAVRTVQSAAEGAQAGKVRLHEELISCFCHCNFVRQSCKLKHCYNPHNHASQLCKLKFCCYNPHNHARQLC